METRTLHKPYQAFCMECGPDGVEMTLRTKDGTRVICPNCFTQLPVPHQFVSTTARRNEIARLKDLSEKAAMAAELRPER